MLGALIGAGASLASSLFKNKSDKSSAKKAAAANYAQQKEFAQSGIRWKVQDAKKAGIHPLYALGASTHSFAPTNVGTSSDFSGLAQAGQDIGRAVDSTRSAPERSLALQITKTQLEGLNLDNDIKRAELASSVAKVSQGTGNPPALPNASTRWMLEGQGNSPVVTDPRIKIETRRDAHEPGKPAHVAGAGPGVAFTRNAQGGYDPTIPPELAESLEQDLIGRIMWSWRNRVLPNLDDHRVSRPNIPRRPYEHVYYDRDYQDWRTKAEITNFRKGRYYR